MGAEKSIYVTNWEEGVRLVAEGYGINIRRTRSGKISGYEGFVAEGVPASYVIEENGYARAGIRIKASQEAYERMHRKLANMLDNAGIDALVTVSYDKNLGFVELSYYGYGPNEGDVALKTLAEAAQIFASSMRRRA